MKIISFIKNFKTVNYKTTIKGQAQLLTHYFKILANNKMQ